MYTFYCSVRLVALWMFLAFPLETPEAKQAVLTFIYRLETLEKSRGLRWTIDNVKGIRQCLLAYFSGTPVRIPGVKLTSDGIPKILGACVPYIRHSDNRVIAYLMTVLYASRALKLGSTPDTETITRAHDGGIPSDFSKYRVQFWRELGYRPSRYRYPKSLEFKSFHESRRAGPNGTALKYAWTDFVALPQELRDQLADLGGPVLKRRLEVLSWGLERGIVTSLKPKEDLKIRKLVSFPDKEMKQRIIAIGDYWSQTCLRPWHQYLFRVLKKIPQDCTFDQSSFKKKVKFDRISYSVDLSSATDRFPVELTVILLKGLLPASKVDLWKKILCDYPFSWEPLGGPSQSLHYTVGTPMGCYGSWASFAVTHHYVMFYLCKKLGINWKEAHYALLGDDIVISDARLGEAYLGFLKEIGVEYSAPKTFISRSVIEFAKRILFNGYEISPFPVGSLLTALKGRWYLLFDTLEVAGEKGWVSQLSTHSEILRLLTLILRLPKRKLKPLSKKFQILELTKKLVRAPDEVQDLLAEVLKVIGLPPLLFTYTTGNSFLSKCALECFQELDPNLRRSGKAKPLGDLAVSLTMKLTDQADEDLEVGIALTESSPILYAYGRLSERYSALLLELRKVDENPDFSWPTTLTAWGLPPDDDRFVESQSESLSRSTNRFSKKITDKLQSLSRQITPAGEVPIV